MSRGCLWSLEQPVSSLMWRYPSIAKLRSLAKIVGSGIYFFIMDMCAHGACVPGEGPIKKPTGVLTNNPALLSLARRCRCKVPHIKLEGSFWNGLKWEHRTAYGGRYPPLLCRRWARCLTPWLGVSSESLRRWQRLLILMGGNVHPHPGPPKGRQQMPVAASVLGDADPDDLDP